MSISTLCVCLEVKAKYKIRFILYNVATSHPTRKSDLSQYIGHFAGEQKDDWLCNLRNCILFINNCIFNFKPLIWWYSDIYGVSIVLTLMITKLKINIVRHKSLTKLNNNRWTRCQRDNFCIDFIAVLHRLVSDFNKNNYSSRISMKVNILEKTRFLNKVDICLWNYVKSWATLKVDFLIKFCKIDFNRLWSLLKKNAFHS